MTGNDPRKPDEAGESRDDSRELRSLFTDSLGGKKSRQLEPVQLVITVYQPELEHLDRIRKKLQEQGRGKLSRDELIRYGINLLNERDFHLER